MSPGTRRGGIEPQRIPGGALPAVPGEAPRAEERLEARATRLRRAGTPLV
ncbi:hypothetical protein [Sorangium sp. So ce341]